jgi:hypothetical protein
MVRVSLREFLATGRFGPVHIGSSRADVQRAFGPPDDRDAQAKSDEAARVWKYGDVEFHFDGGGARASVWLIHTDSFVSVPQGGRKVDLDPWIVSRALGEGSARSELAKAAITYASGPYAYDTDLDELRTAVGVSLVFSGRRDQGRRDRALVSMSLARRSR